QFSYKSATARQSLNSVVKAGNGLLNRQAGKSPPACTAAIISTAIRMRSLAPTRGLNFWIVPQGAPGGLYIAPKTPTANKSASRDSVERRVGPIWCTSRLAAALKLSEKRLHPWKISLS